MAHSQLFRRLACLTVAIGMAACFSAANTGPIKKLTLDPSAEIVPLFTGEAAGQFEIRTVALNAHQANVIIANATDKPLTAALPKAAVAVHILPQFNPQNPGFFANPFGLNQQGGGQPGGLNGNLEGLNGLAQNTGGPMQATGPGNPGFQQIGQGFPSVPAEWKNKAELDQYGGFATIPPGKSIQLQLRTVCLNYGRPEPHQRLTYRLTPVEKYSSDPVLAELLESDSPRTDNEVLQAAAWHVANNLTWQQLAQLPDRQLHGTSAKLFNVRQLQAAQALLERVQKQAAQRPQPTEPPTIAATRTK